MRTNGAGKGDKRRPSSVSEEVYAANYQKAFGKKKPWYESEAHKKNVEELRKIKQSSTEKESNA